jgi:hypothetical protein
MSLSHALPYLLFHMFVLHLSSAKYLPELSFKAHVCDAIIGWCDKVEAMYLHLRHHGGAKPLEEALWGNKECLSNVVWIRCTRCNFAQRLPYSVIY